MVTTLEPPRLPFEPESISRAWTRYPGAVDPIYTVTQMITLRPGRDRRHVFDFDDGLRLIVSREVIGHRVCIHFSGSAGEHTPIFREVRKLGERGLETFYARCVERFQSISNDKRPTEFVGLAPGGSAHWIIPE